MEMESNEAAKRLNVAYTFLKNCTLVESKKDFADNIGVTHTHLAAIFSGRHKVTKKLARSIEDKYFIFAEWLLKGIGSMHPSLKGLIINDNTIHHVPKEDIGILRQPATQKDEFKSNLKQWSVPGLKGEFLSFYIENNDLYPKFPEGSLIVVSEVKNYFDVIPGRYYVFVTKDALFAAFVLRINEDEFELEYGNLSFADTLNCYYINMGVMKDLPQPKNETQD